MMNILMIKKFFLAGSMCMAKSTNAVPGACPVVNERGRNVFRRHLLRLCRGLFLLAALVQALPAYSQECACPSTLSTFLAPPQTGLQSASVGLAGLNIAFSPGDAFSLHVRNADENPWTYQLIVVTDQGIFMSAAQSLVFGAEADFSAALGGVAGVITSTYLVISGNVPLPDGDRISEYQVSCAHADESGFITLGQSDIGGFSQLAASSEVTVSINNGILDFPAPGSSKNFDPVLIGLPEISTLTLTVDNSDADLEASSLAVTDNLPLGLQVAATPNASTSCSGGTLTAVAATGVVSYSGSSGCRCFLHHRTGCQRHRPWHLSKCDRGTHFLAGLEWHGQ